jgi:O-antigen/teichoic acid export membrane protein
MAKNLNTRDRHRPQHRRKRARVDKETLTGKASRALGWSFASTIFGKLALFGIGIALARILGPHAFGTYAVAYVALLALLTFNELGVSLAIVRWQGDPREIMPTVMTVSLCMSTTIYLACFFVAPLYTSAMGAPQATGVIRVLALLLIVDGFTNTPAALLQRNFRQGQRTIVDQANVWVATGTTFALAWAGYGAMSLAIGRLVGCLVGAVLLVTFAPHSLRFGFDTAKARSLLRFGLPLAGAELLTFAVTTVDQVVVGHLLGIVALGFYALALNVANWPITIFSQPLSAVAPAVFARLQHDSSVMSSTFLVASRLLTAVALPVCLLLAGSSVPLISFIYGARWDPAARPLLFLAILAAVQVFFLLAYDFLVVLARSRFLLVVQLAWLLALVPALIIGSDLGGISGASLAEVAVATICVLPWYIFELRRAGIGLRALAGHHWLPIAGAAVAGMAAAIGARTAPNAIIALTVDGAITVAVTGLLIYHMRSTLTSLRSLSAQPSVSGDRSGVPPGDEAICTAETIRDAMVLRNAASAPQPPSFSRRINYPVPMSSCHDLGKYPEFNHGLADTSPLYRATVESLRWDPARTSHRAQPTNQLMVTSVLNLKTNEAGRAGHVGHIANQVHRSSG